MSSKEADRLRAIAKAAKESGVVESTEPSSELACEVAAFKLRYEGVIAPEFEREAKKGRDRSIVRCATAIQRIAAVWVLAEMGFSTSLTPGTECCCDGHPLSVCWGDQFVA